MLPASSSLKHGLFCSMKVSRSPPLASALGTQQPSSQLRHLSSSLDLIDTPFLAVDLDASRRNCRRLLDLLSPYPSIFIRPHAKAHKTVELVRLQQEVLGTRMLGPCAQTLQEAELLVYGGIKDVLLSNQIAPTAPKMERLALLLASPSARGLKLGICVDGPEQIEALQGAVARARDASGAAPPVEVLVEVNGGQNRCGVETADQAVALAESIASNAAKQGGSPGLVFRGIQVYHGGLQHVRDPKDRAARVADVSKKAGSVRDALLRAGLKCDVVSGGGSGSFLSEAGSKVFTEIQPGSFLLGDADYGRNPDWKFEQALWIYTSVLSTSQERKAAIVDAGLKAVALDSGPPQVPGSQPSGYTCAGLEYKSGGDQHGFLLLPQDGSIHAQGPAPLPQPGSLIRLQPGHCDPQVNLYDELVALQGGAEGKGVEVVGRYKVGRGPGV